jgi:glycolate oxidase FAD binding subunit
VPNWGGWWSIKVKLRSLTFRGFEDDACIKDRRADAGMSARWRRHEAVEGTDLMSSTFKPTDDTQVLDAVAWALGAEAPLDVIGRGSKRGFGRPFQADHTLDLSALSGINFYEPEELVLSAKPSTPIAEIEAPLAERGQMLAFEPMDMGPLFGQSVGLGSIGGAFACNLSGPRRIKMGAARDHLLGFNAVSGRGEAFKSGGRVVKNVTGYDLSKLITGSFGTLSVITELTFKVLPAPEKTYTVLLSGLDGAFATRAMSVAMNSSHEVAGAVYLPAEIAKRSGVSFVAGASGSITALRLEGFGPSVEQRCRDFREELADFGALEELHSRNSVRFWSEIRDVVYLAEPADRVIWRLSVPPSAGAGIFECLRISHGAEAFLDWSGGLIWLSLPASDDGDHDAVREAVATSGGHATLIRAPSDVRAAVPVFQPQPASLGALSARVKDSFDPKRVLNPGRMVAGI